jgi:hypothetical protein
MKNYFNIYRLCEYLVDYQERTCFLCKKTTLRAKDLAKDIVLISDEDALFYIKNIDRIIGSLICCECYRKLYIEHIW